MYMSFRDYPNDLWAIFLGAGLLFSICSYSQQMFHVPNTGPAETMSKYDRARDKILG